MNIEKFTSIMLYDLNAKPLIESEIDYSLAEEEIFEKGFLLTDPVINLTLLSKVDFTQLSPEDAGSCIVNNRSVFDHILVIVFKYKGQDCIRILNGLASKLHLIAQYC